MSEIDLSIIIPAYNPPSGSFEECCLSIQGQQTSWSYEVIVVDDCSSTIHGNEVRRLCGRHMFNYIRNECNLGVSASRNRALQEAQGEFIAFVDADDCLYPDFVQDALDLARDSGSDCVIGSLATTEAAPFLPERKSGARTCRMFEGKSVLEVMEGTLAGRDFLPREVSEASSFVHAGPVGRLYRRSILTRNEIKFDRSLACGEDIIFNLDYLSLCSSCVVTSAVWYQYRMYGTSATNGIEPKQLEGQIDFCRKLLGCGVVRRYNLIEAAYGRVLGGLKSLIRRQAASNEYPGFLLLEAISGLLELDVFQTASRNIDLSRFDLSLVNLLFAKLCKNSCSYGLFLMARINELIRPRKQ